MNSKYLANSFTYKKEIAVDKSCSKEYIKSLFRCILPVSKDVRKYLNQAFNMDITTLGRGGSDTSAVAITAVLGAQLCYIFSDVDGVYTTDPNQVTVARKIDSLSYEEMLDIADEGAKVLHNRCVEVGEKFGVPIVAKSTFQDGSGTEINNKPLEGTVIKNIVKNDKLIYVHGTSNVYSIQNVNDIYNLFVAFSIKCNFRY